MKDLTLRICFFKHQKASEIVHIGFSSLFYVIEMRCQEVNSSLILMSDFFVADIVSLTENRRGQIKYKGRVEGKQGIVYGIHLSKGEGLHEGTHNGKSYFKCEGNKGVFVPKQHILGLVYREDDEKKKNSQQRQGTHQKLGIHQPKVVKKESKQRRKSEPNGGKSIWSIFGKGSKKETHKKSDSAASGGWFKFHTWKPPTWMNILDNKNDDSVGFLTEKQSYTAKKHQKKASYKIKNVTGIYIHLYLYLYVFVD